MIDTNLLAAIRTALRENEIGDQSPYQLSYARKGDSGGSFGAFQGDVHADPLARATLTAVLQSAKLDPAAIDRIVTAVGQACPNGSPLTPADQQAADAALQSAQGRALVDAMDGNIFQRILGCLDSSIAAARSVNRLLDNGAQISIALWSNMTGAPTTLNDWLKGTPVNGVAPPMATTATRDDIERYLKGTKYFEQNPNSLDHFEASVDAGLKTLPTTLVAATSAVADKTAFEPLPDAAGSAGQIASRAQPPGKAPEDAMLGYFLSTLEVRALAIMPTIGNDPIRKELFGKLRTSLDEFTARYPSSAAPTNHAAWSEAYRIERIIALVEPAWNLVGELKRQTAEAVEERIPAAGRLLSTLEAALPLAMDTSHSPPVLRDGGETILRALLLQTLEELHWNSQRKFYARPIQKSATYRIVYLGIGAFLLFLAPYILIYAEILAGNATLATWSGLPLYTALTAGLFGAFFSRLIYLQQNWNALTLGAIMDARDVTSIILRGCVGMTGATMVYFFLQSNTMTGALLPDFAKIGFEQLMFPSTADKSVTQIRLFYPNPALALLVVWCFLAGFSERLVPSILETTEASLGKKEAAK